MKQKIKMRIVHVAESFSAGVLEFINYLTNSLGEFEHVIIYGEREIKERNANIEEIKKRFPSNTTFIKWNDAQREINLVKDVKAAYNLWKLLKEIEYTALHLHSSKAGFLGRFLIPFLKNKNVLYTPHSVYFLRTDLNFFKKQLAIFLERLANKMGGKIICCSFSEQNAFLKKKINASFINNGIPITSIPSISPLQNKFIIVTSGRISPQKNPILFNKIAKQFIENIEIEFIWIGDGNLRTSLNSSNIKITGWITKEEVFNYLSKSDLYISTSLWEGLPYSVLEAMNYAKPLLLKNCVGNIDLVENNYNGFNFKTAEEAVDYIRKFLSNKSLISKFGSNSRKKCEEEFDINKTALLYSKIYSKNNGGSFN